MDIWTTIAIIAALAVVFMVAFVPTRTSRARLGFSELQALAREHRQALAEPLAAGRTIDAIRHLRALRPDLTLAEAKAAVDMLIRGLD